MSEDKKMSDQKSATTKAVKPAIMLFMVFWLITGIIYPLTVYAVSQFLFPAQAQGNLIHDNQGILTGSKLIGQPFTGEKYFWPRPSMTSGYPYNPLVSGGRNLGPTSKTLIDEISKMPEIIFINDSNDDSVCLFLSPLKGEVILSSLQKKGTFAVSLSPGGRELE